MAHARLSEITVYPIKSCGGATVETAAVEARGLQFDRRWLLVDSENRFLTQRDFSRMARISVAVEAEHLRVAAEHFDDLLIPLAPGSTDRIRVQIWADKCDAIVHEPKINGWFSEVLQTDCRLVFMPDDARRFVEPDYRVHDSDITSFSDAFPYLLIGENSLDDLNSRLEKPVAMNRFRPNFTIQNAAAFAEDDWRQIKIGAATFHAVKQCARCVVTTIDQRSGESDGKNPLQTLAQFRTVKSNGRNKIVFGQYLIAENPGAAVRVGDRIEILK